MTTEDARRRAKNEPNKGIHISVEACRLDAARALSSHASEKEGVA